MNYETALRYCGCSNTSRATETLAHHPNLWYNSQREELLMMPDSKAKREWDANNTVFVGLKLNRNTDADLLEFLETVPSKQGVIKEALRAHISCAKNYNARSKEDLMRHDENASKNFLRWLETGDEKYTPAVKDYEDE